MAIAKKVIRAEKAGDARVTGAPPDNAAKTLNNIREFSGHLADGTAAKPSGIISIKPYADSDLNDLVRLYQSAFAEPPWNEYKQCACCGVEYGRIEVRLIGEREQPLNDHEEPAGNCKKCSADMPANLRDFWTREKVEGDLGLALRNTNPIVLVAREISSDSPIGFTWGYRISFEHFPFLRQVLPENTLYIDEIAVAANQRRKGIGKSLGQELIRMATQNGLTTFATRTDERNDSSMALFEHLGFTGIPDAKDSRGFLFDPAFQNRIYLRLKVE